MAKNPITRARLVSKGKKMKTIRLFRLGIGEN